MKNLSVLRFLSRPKLLDTTDWTVYFLCNVWVFCGIASNIFTSVWRKRTQKDPFSKLLAEKRTFRETLVPKQKTQFSRWDYKVEDELKPKWMFIGDLGARTEVSKFKENLQTSKKDRFWIFFSHGCQIKKLCLQPISTKSLFHVFFYSIKKQGFFQTWWIPVPRPETWQEHFKKN